MSDLLQIVKGLSMQPKCVLVLGARTEAMLNWLFSLTATQVVLVEPEPAMFEKATLLHNAKSSPESVVIKHGVPAFEANQKSMRCFVSNVPGYSSVLPPNVIKSIRPALEFTEQDTAVIELKPLLQQYDISESRPCLLISQLNGAEQQCLNNQLLNAFTHVVIQSSLKPVYGESKPAEKLKKEFTECGRDYLALAEPMPPYSNFVATKKVNAKQALDYFSQRQQHREIKAKLESQFNVSQSNVKKVDEELQQTKQRLQIANQQAEEKQKQLSDELQQAKQRLQIANQQAEEKQKQLSDELQQTKQRLQTANQKAEEKQKQLGEELLQANEQLKVAEEQSKKKQNQLDEELKQTKQQLQTTSQQAEEKQRKIVEKMNLANQQLLKERDQEQHWHRKNKEWAEALNLEKTKLIENNEELLDKLSRNQHKSKELTDEIAGIKANEKSLMSSLEINTKLILKMQLDFDDLRKKYKDKVKSENELKKLIGQLHNKLQQAANFYHQLEHQHPELLLGRDNVD